WDLSSGKEISTFQGHQSIVTSVAFSPDGKILATASRTIKLWSLDLDDLLAKGCKYLEAYFITRPKKKKELCPES
ncbi:MAG: hypothetical protein MJK14_28995, partial [Rivularia sp. ALOHA_DT_140]|nr:hypothetical protein [Rivularia sp. ALOHA_DT_140]